MRELPAALSAFTAYRQFILYKTVPSETRPGKTDKLPIDHRTGVVSDAHNPEIRLDFQTAINTAAARGAPFGVGFVFTPDDPFWFLDIDNCALFKDGLCTGWAPHAQQLCKLLAGCYIEVSQSGTGLHLFGRGKPPAHCCRNDALKIEFYHSRRFCALTGINPSGDAGADFTSVLPTLVSVYFPPDASAGDEVEWSDTPVPEWNGIKDDAELIRRAMASTTAASSFGQKASFADLWLADTHALGRAFPDAARPFDESAADSSLAQHLAFWTGKDCERIRRLMYQSKLVRDKWEREDYLPRTILGVVVRQIDVYRAPELQNNPQSLPGATSATADPATPAQTAVSGSRILGADGQQPLFAGMVYITDLHRVLIPGGHVLKPDQFRVHFGGFNFIMDQNNERMSRDPWEAFTQSQLLRPPAVNGTCFRPEMPAGIVITRNGQTFVNTYVPVDIARITGDATPFLMHLARVLPDQRDQTIFLSYMAACVQYKGIKFQWAPVVQGVEGNGKTIFSRCVAEAIGRRYVHWPKASKLAKEFNAWMVGKILYAVEDIYVPDARREVIEELKPMITGGDGLEIEAKGVDQTSADICGNFMFNSNHRDAIKKTGNDRRFCVLFTAQQESGHLARDGMQGDYFPRLYDWLRADGYAIVSDFLHTFSILSEFNPAGECQRAPFSSTTGEALQASQGSIEQEILEAVAQGQTGFHGGWISSIYLDRLLDRMGMRKVSHTRRREILKSLGFDYHPALMDGRVNNPVLPDGGKPRLYIHENCLARSLTSPAEVAKFYEASNVNQPQLNVWFDLHRAGGRRA